MNKTVRLNKTNIRRNTSVEGEPIERKLERMMENKEGFTETIPQIYTERKDGVMPEYNIRTDRFEVAIEGMDKVEKSLQARREERAKMRDGETEPIQTTE